MIDYDQESLIRLIRESEALKFGKFTLASGKQADYYLDCRRVTLTAEGANLIATGMLARLDADMPDAVGGMAIGADPITAAIITVAGIRGQSLRGFMVRKQPKGHGTGQFVEGPVQAGDRVVVVEDVVTSGGSALQAIERAAAVGLRVQKVLGIIDRLEGGAEAIAKAGYTLETLLTVRDFGIEPPST